MYKSVVAGIETGPADSRKTGKAALERLCDQYMPYALYGDDKWYVEKVIDKHGELNNNLGNYFRVIYRLYAYLSDIGQDGNFFADMFRAQLTTAELHLLFFNCVSKVGKPMERYAIQFELFDNMPIPSGQNFGEVVKMLDAKSFGKNDLLIKLLGQ